MKGVGLENFSNNCYLNSIVQIFLHIPEIIEYISQGMLNGVDVRRNSIILDYSCDQLSLDENDNKQVKVVEAFVGLFEAVTSNMKSHYISPYSLKATMGKIDSTFDLDEECDAQEFYLAFINALQQGLNRRKENQPKIDSNVDLSILSNYKLYICQQRRTIVDRLFLGALGNHVSCSACKDVSCAFDIFFNVAISLPLKKKKIKLAIFSNDLNWKPTIENIEINIYTETTVSCLRKMSPPIVLKNSVRSESNSSLSDSRFTPNNKKNSYTPKNSPNFFLFTLGLSYVRLAKQNELVCNVVDYDNSLILGAECPRDDVGNCFLVRQYINNGDKNQFVSMNTLRKRRDFNRKFKSSIVNRIIDKCFHNNSRTNHPPITPLGSHYVGLPFLIALPNYLQHNKICFYDWLREVCGMYLKHIDYIAKTINSSFYPFDINDGIPEFKIIATLKEMTRVIVDKSFDLSMMEHTIALDLVWNCTNSPGSPYTYASTFNSISQLNVSIPSNWSVTSNSIGYAVVVPERTNFNLNTPTKIISNSSFTDPARMCKIRGKNSNPYDILADLQIFRSRSFDCTLDECIELFFNETIYIKNRVCSKCNYVGDSIGIVKLAMAPTILTIQLKRFDYQCGGKKTDILVDIPINIVIQPKYIDQAESGIHYRLVGMVCHIGTFSFGHYFTIVDELGMYDPSSNANRWILFDDISVDYINEYRFTKFKTWAYLLFFKRVN